MNRKGSTCPGARTRGKGDGTPSRLLALRYTSLRWVVGVTPRRRPSIGSWTGRPGRISVLRPGTEVRHRPNRSRPQFAPGSPTRSSSPRSSPSLDAQEEKVALARQRSPKESPSSHAQENRPKVAQSITPSPRSDRPTKSRRPRLSPSPRPHSSPERTSNRPESPRIAQNRPRETPNRRRGRPPPAVLFFRLGDDRPLTFHFEAMHQSRPSLRMKISPSEKAGEA